MATFDEYQEALTGITAGYAFDDGIEPKVPYSFMGSIFDECEREALLSVLRQDALTMGPQVSAFEREFADWVGAKHAFATSNCTTALHIAAQVLGIGEGDEVVTTPNTFWSTTLVIVKEGGIPVFADIDPRTYNIDPKEIAKKITAKTKAIFVTHFSGLMCDMDPIMELGRQHGIPVMADCAHAHGAEYKGRQAGSVADICCFSFHSLKTMTMGEGGMITTSRDDLVDDIGKMRNMSITGWGNEDLEEYWLPSHFDVVDTNGKWGMNYRLTEFQAAMGRCQLQKLPDLVARRIENGHYLNEGLKDVEGYIVPYEDPNCKHVYHLYTLCVDPEILDRDDVIRDVYYKQHCTQGILHYQPNYDFTGMKKYLEERGYGGQFCPNADKYFYKQQFNLPMNPRLTREELDAMIEGLTLAARRCRK